MWASYIGALSCMLPTLCWAFWLMCINLARGRWWLPSPPLSRRVVQSVVVSILRHPRPNNTQYLNKIERCLDGGVYGMPSGHAQLVGLTLCISLQMRLHPVLSLCLLTQTLVTLWQRYVYKKHTIEQLVWGLIVGYVTGFLYVFMISYSIH